MSANEFEVSPIGIRVKVRGVGVDQKVCPNLAAISEEQV
jgi:hypothetical protein